eukprot:880847-Prorocentrum_lima.AAC.1
MTSSLVGSEMCIRDRHCHDASVGKQAARNDNDAPGPNVTYDKSGWSKDCLLYTSDAADDM